MDFLLEVSAFCRVNKSKKKIDSYGILCYYGKKIQTNWYNNLRFKLEEMK